MQLGLKFRNFKEDVNSLRIAVDSHFTRVVQQLEDGLPDVIDETCANSSGGNVPGKSTSHKGGSLYKFETSAAWMCLLCLNENAKDATQCTICRSNRPNTMLDPKK